MSGKVLRVSAEDAKYIDPKQIVSLTMVDGSTIYVKDEGEGFVEENQEGVEQALNEQAQPEQKQQPLRGFGTNLALGVAATTTAALGAAAIGRAISGRPMGPPMMGPKPPMMGPMRGPMMGPPRGGPMMGPMRRF